MYVFGLYLVVLVLAKLPLVQSVQCDHSVKCGAVFGKPECDLSRDLPGFSNNRDSGSFCESGDTVIAKMNVVESENLLGLRPPVLVVILGSLVLGGIFFALGYIVIKLGRPNKNISTTKKSDQKDVGKSTTEEQDSANSGSGSGANTTGTNSKRAKKKRREAQQEFNHPWVAGALKGHTSPVLDMSFSSTGKFLASCAEDSSLMPEDDLDLVNSSKKRETSPPSLPTKELEDRTPLSRRQRKNRTRGPRDQQRAQDEDRKQSQSDLPLLNRTPHCWLQTHDRHFQDAPASNATSSSVKMKTQANVRCPFKVEKGKLKTTGKKKNILADYSSTNNCNSKKLEYQSIQREKLKHLDDSTLEYMLRVFFPLSDEQRSHGGYPIQCKERPTCAFINSYHGLPNHRVRNQRLDVNAREFVPGGTPSSRNAVESEADSGNGSGSSVENSDLEQESSSDSDKCDNSKSSSSSDYQNECILPGPGISKRESQFDDYRVQRKCARCFLYFDLDSRNGEYLGEQECMYHWGKRRNGIWECCQARQYDGIWGCTTAKMHVWTGIVPGVNGPLEGYVSTRPLGKVPENGCFGIYGLDAEMCFTNRGLELAKVSVVNLNGTVVYNEFVKPEAEVIDYNTRFSGITAKDLANASKTLKDVQNDLLRLIHSETILIGHGLENDLRALRIFHKMVVDTSFVYPHIFGPLYRKSLRTLAHTELGQEIQNGTHDSIEDARTAVELMLCKLLKMIPLKQEGSRSTVALSKNREPQFSYYFVSHKF